MLLLRSLFQLFLNNSFCCRFLGIFLRLLGQLYLRILHVKLMDVRCDVSLRQMCNEPCFVFVTFGMMDHNGRPFNRQRCIPFNNMQQGGCHTLKSKAWNESLAHDKGSLSLQPRPASADRAGMKRRPACLSFQYLKQATSRWTADFTAVTAANHGNLIGFTAPTAQSVHFVHSPLSHPA